LKQYFNRTILKKKLASINTSEGVVAVLKIGVIGGGHIAKHRHIPIFKKMRDVEVSAICDAVEPIAKGVAQQFGIHHVYTDSAAMLKDGLDIVDITTPPKSHFSLAIQAMEAGCHVLAEKPLAMTTTDVDGMTSEAKRQNVRLCVVHQNLYNPVVQKTMNLIKQGIVGDVISVDVATLVRKDNYMCVNKNHWCHKLPGGIFFEVLPHPIYLSQVFLKNIRPSYVLSKKLGNYEWMKTDETRTLMEGTNGIGLIVASCNSPYHGDTLSVFGTKMGLEVDLWGRSIIKYKPQTENPVSVGRRNLSLASQFLGLVGTTVSSAFAMAVGGERISAHYGFLRAFINSIEAGSPMPVSDAEARENVRIVQEICKEIDRAHQDN
jgi:predicted dehydrogenase